MATAEAESTAGSWSRWRAGLSRWLRPADLPWAAAALLETSVRLLVPLPLQLRLAAAEGRLRDRAALSTYADNIRLALKPCQPQIDAEAVAARYAGFRRQYSLLARPRLPRLHDLARCPVEGLEHLSQALREGRGAILVSSHFGYVSVVPHVLQAHGYEVWQLRARSSKRRAAERRQFRSYSKLKRRLFKQLYGEPGSLPWDRVIIAEFNVRPMVNALQQNQVINLLGDGTNATRRLPVRALGRTLYLAGGYINVALRNRTPVLPVFALEDRRHGIRLIIEAPLDLTATADQGQAIHDGVQQFATAWERRILQAPHLLPGHHSLEWLAKLEHEGTAADS